MPVQVKGHVPGIQMSALAGEGTHPGELNALKPSRPLLPMMIGASASTCCVLLDRSCLIIDPASTRLICLQMQNAELRS